MAKLLLGNLNYSSWSIRAALVARTSGLEIEEQILPLAVPGTRETLIAQTGFHQVPALIERDLIVRDSLAITEWLAEQAAPGKVWPTDAGMRARARTVVAEMHSSFTALRKECWVDIRKRVESYPVSAACQRDIDRVQQIWRACLESSGGPFLFGDWGAADAFYAPVVTRFRTYGIALDEAAQTYSSAVFAHPEIIRLEAEAQAERWIMAPGEHGMEYQGDLPG